MGRVELTTVGGKEVGMGKEGADSEEVEVEEEGAGPRIDETAQRLRNRIEDNHSSETGDVENC